MRVRYDFLGYCTAVLLQASIVISLVISAAEAAELSIGVFDPDGRVVSGARVSAWRQDEHGFIVLAERSVTDDEGVAELSLPDDSDSVLSIAAPGYRRIIQALEAGQTGALEFTLDRGRIVKITVVDVDGGRPISEFTALTLPVDAGGTSPDRLAFSAEGIELLSFSDPLGRAIISGLGDEPIALVVRAEGYAPGIVGFVSPDTEKVSVELDSTGCERWLVVDAETGVGIPDARAAGAPELLEGPLARIASAAVTNEAGFMTLCPSEASGRTLIIDHSDYAPTEIPAPSGNEEDSSRTISLDIGGTITGHLRDADGMPVARAIVETSTAGLSRKVETGDDGFFALSRLGPGALDIVVRSPTRNDGAPLLRRKIEISQGETKRVELDLSEGLAIRIEEGGLPVEDALVVLLIPDAEGKFHPGFVGTSRENGVARLQGATDPEAAHVLAVKQGDSAVFMPAPRKRADDPNDAALVVKLRGTRINGKVFDDEKRPLAGAQILCSRGATMSISPRRSPLWFSAAGAEILAARGPASLAYSDTRGRFEMLLPEWCKTLLVSGPKTSDDDLPWRRAALGVASLDLSEALEIRLERGTLIHVAVSIDGPPPSAPTFVALRRPNARTDLETTTLVDGSARLEPGDEGPWLVVATSAGKAPAVYGPFRAQTGQVFKVKLEVEEGAFIQISDGGEPNDVRLLDRQGRDWMAIADSAFSAERSAQRIGPLPLGRYEVKAGDSSARVTLRQVGQEERIDLSD